MSDRNAGYIAGNGSEQDAGIDAYFNDWYEEQCEVAAGRALVKNAR